MSLYSKEIKETVLELIHIVVQHYDDLSVYLVGSYATNTQTLGSDIDILIFSNEQEKDSLIQFLKDLIASQYALLLKKIDCKVLSRQEVLQSQSINYLFLYSALKNGMTLSESRFTLKFSPDKLRDSLYEIEEKISAIKTDIRLQRNFSKSAFALFSLTKSLYYLNGLIRDVNNCKSSKKVLGKYFYPLERVYESFAPKGVVDSIDISLIKRSQRSGGFRELVNAMLLVEEYLVEVKRSFLQWYDQNVMRQV